MKIFKKLMEGLQWAEVTTLQHIAGIFFFYNNHAESKNDQSRNKKWNLNDIKHL